MRKNLGTKRWTKVLNRLDFQWMANPFGLGHRQRSVTRIPVPLLFKHDVVGKRIERIGHSQPSDPTFVLEGIGPAQFRAHYLLLNNGIVLDLFTAELTYSTIDKMVSAGETDGIAVDELIGRTITDVWNDDTSSCILVLDDEIYLKDANDGCYGNPLRAGYIVADYDESERAKSPDYWTDDPVKS